MNLAYFGASNVWNFSIDLQPSYSPLCAKTHLNSLKELALFDSYQLHATKHIQSTKEVKDSKNHRGTGVGTISCF